MRKTNGNGELRTQNVATIVLAEGGVGEIEVGALSANSATRLPK